MKKKQQTVRQLLIGMSSLFLTAASLAQTTPPAPNAGNTNFGDTKVLLRWNQSERTWEPGRIGTKQPQNHRTVCLNTEMEPVYLTAAYPIASANISSGTLPTGISGSLNSNIYTISGTPTASGVYDYTVSFVNGAGKTGNVVGRINVITGAACLPPIPDPETLPVGAAGAGTLYGITCFDVAANADPSDNATVAQRLTGSLPTDFTDRSGVNTVTPYKFSGVQTYTFTANTANISNIRYVISDSDNVIDRSEHTELSGVLQEGVLANGSSINLVIHYKPDLNTSHALVNAGRAGAAKATLTIIYYDGTKDVKAAPLTVSIQDGACCGANTGTSTWKTFMCHNLGADQTLDPFTPAAGIHGAKYKWGRGLVALDQVTDQSNSGTVSGWTSVGGTPPSTSVDWDMTSRPPNPCPTGYRVPIQAEWQGVISNNGVWVKSGDWTNLATNYSSGAMIGSGLFLPAAGWRRSTDGTLFYRGNNSIYWSRTVNNSVSAYYLVFDRLTQNTDNSNKLDGFSVRCIAE
jgi:uncharacterized protein (TIGR02145 family)